MMTPAAFQDCKNMLKTWVGNKLNYCNSTSMPVKTSHIEVMFPIATIQPLCM